MFNKENFVSATFIDQDRRYIEVLYTHDDEVHPFVVDFEDTENSDTKRLLDIHDLESIELLTAQTKKEERESFEKMVMGIAKREGLIPENTVEVSKDSNYVSLDSLVFEWDGLSDSGDKLPSTDYYYIIKYKNNSYSDRTGVVTLIR